MPLPTLRLPPHGSQRTARGETWFGYSFVPGDLHPLPSASSPGAPDPDVPRKQRHTAHRIFERLRDEHGFSGGYTIQTVWKKTTTIWWLGRCLKYAMVVHLRVIYQRGDVESTMELERGVAMVGSVRFVVTVTFGC